MGKPDYGRLVLNHSTHVDGLIQILERLIKQPGIVTITPGVISRARANAPQMVLKISVPIRGGFKVLARKGKTVQEVFILTSLDQENLEKAISGVMK